MKGGTKQLQNVSQYLLTTSQKTVIFIFITVRNSCLIFSSRHIFYLIILVPCNKVRQKLLLFYCYYYSKRLAHVAYDDLVRSTLKKRLRKVHKQMQQTLVLHTKYQVLKNYIFIFVFYNVLNTYTFQTYKNKFAHLLLHISRLYLQSMVNSLLKIL